MEESRDKYEGAFQDIGAFSEELYAEADRPELVKRMKRQVEAWRQSFSRQATGFVSIDVFPGKFDAGLSLLIV